MGDELNALIIAAAFILICFLVVILIAAMFQPPIRPSPVGWQGKLRVIRRYGLPGTIILLVYWRRTWDMLLNDTVPMPRRWTVKMRESDGLPDDQSSSKGS